MIGSETNNKDAGGRASVRLLAFAGLFALAIPGSRAFAGQGVAPAPESAREEAGRQESPAAESDASKEPVVPPASVETATGTQETQEGAGETKKKTPPAEDARGTSGAETQQPVPPTTEAKEKEDKVNEPDAEAAAPSVPVPVTPAPSPVAPRYRAPTDWDNLLAGWLGTGLAETVSLGKSIGGNELLAVQFGAPGPTPLADRTTILLVGGLDGISLAGSQSVIAITDSLLATPDRLPTEVTFLSVPWANPDGLERWLEGGATSGSNARPMDDDHDGAVDEDGADDLDGDGLILEMLIEDPDGPWVRGEGGRFLRPAHPGEAPRYIRVPEGRDDDGDGLYNEDPIGGVVLDRNFPVNWRGPWTGIRSGDHPLSEPASKALADLAISRRLAIALVFQGNHGHLAGPGGAPAGPGVLALPFASDAPAYRALSEFFVHRTGRVQPAPISLAEVHPEGGAPGSSVDWFYAALGALSAEVAVWGPEVDSAALGEESALFRPGTTTRPAVRTAAGQATEAGARKPDLEHAWARWLDETRGGLGFVEWQPVDLGDGRSTLVGGWQPFTCFNPPADLLPAAIGGLGPFVLDLATALPRLEVEVLEERRTGRVAILRARVRNLGGLPSGVGPEGPRTNARLRLELPPGVELLAGEREVDLGHLPAQGQSATFDWLLMAPADSVFGLVIESPWLTPKRKEIRL